MSEWDEEKKELLDTWYKRLLSKHTKYYFLSDMLKNDESKFTWSAFVISAIITTLNSLEIFHNMLPIYVVILMKILLVIIGLSMTLTIGWIKHNQYTTRISECERLLQTLEDLKGILKSEIDMPLDHKANASEFINHFRKPIALAMKNSPRISPNELKQVIEEVRNKFPELATECGWDIEDTTINPFVSNMNKN